MGVATCVGKIERKTSTRHERRQDMGLDNRRLSRVRVRGGTDLLRGGSIGQANSVKPADDGCWKDSTSCPYDYGCPLRPAHPIAVDANWGFLLPRHLPD